MQWLGLGHGFRDLFFEVHDLENDLQETWEMQHLYYDGRSNYNEVNKMSEVKELDTLYHLYRYVSERKIDDEERLKRLEFAEKKRKEFFEIEKKMENKNVYWHLILLISELNYYYVKYSMHEKISGKEIIEYINRGDYTFGRSDEPLIATILVSMFQTGKSDEAISVLQKLTPVFLDYLKVDDSYFTPSYPVEEFVKFLLEAIPSLDEAQKWDFFDSLVSLIANNIGCFFLLEPESQVIKRAGDYLDQMLEMVDSDSLRYQFIQSIKNEYFELVGTEKDEVQDSQCSLKKIMQKMNLAGFEENKDTILFFINLYRDNFLESFLVSSYEMKSSSSTTKWKIDLLKGIAFESEKYWDTFRNMHSCSLSYPRDKWAPEYLEKNKKRILDELSKKDWSKYSFFRIATSLYLSERKYQQAADFLFEIEEKDEEVYRLIADVYKAVKQYEDILIILQDAKEDGIEVDDLINEISEVKVIEDEKNKKAAAEGSAKLKNAYFGLDKLTRKILIIIYELLKNDDKVRPEQIMNVLRWKENQNRFLMQHVNKLIQHGMVHSDGNTLFSMDPMIAELVEKVADPKLEAQVIKASSNKLYKQVFFHGSELDLYRVLCDLFPQSYVFPNMSLQTIIDYEKLKPLVNNETFQYYLMTHVDFAIVNSFSYFPMIVIEKDSDYHNHPDVVRKDNMKNLIFQLSGIPLIRIRYTSAMSAEQLRRDIISATKPFILEHLDKEDHFSKTLIQSVDLSKFEVAEEVDLKKVSAIVASIVGPSIKDRITVLGMEDERLVIEIPQDLFVLTHSKPHIEKELKREFSAIKEVDFRWI